MTRSDSDMPFDTRQYPHIIYAGQISTLRARLYERLIILSEKACPRNAERVMGWNAPRYEAEWIAFIEERADDEGIDRIVACWSESIDRRWDVAGHAFRLAEQTVELARSIGISEKDIVHIRRGALLHDVGTVSLPDSIIFNRGKLNDHEEKIYREHPLTAYEMLFQVPVLRKAIDIPSCHHEMWNGSGYPRGISGKDIPISARIFAVVNMFEALTMNRPYRNSFSVQAAIKTIKDSAGTILDPDIVDAFMRLHAFS